MEIESFDHTVEVLDRHEIERMFAHRTGRSFARQQRELRCNPEIEPEEESVFGALLSELYRP